MAFLEFEGVGEGLGLGLGLGFGLGLGLGQPPPMSQVKVPPTSNVGLPDKRVLDVPRRSTLPVVVMFPPSVFDPEPWRDKLVREELLPTAASEIAPEPAFRVRLRAPLIDA